MCVELTIGLVLTADIGNPAWPACYHPKVSETQNPNVGP